MLPEMQSLLKIVRILEIAIDSIATRGPIALNQSVHYYQVLLSKMFSEKQVIRLEGLFFIPKRKNLHLRLKSV